MDQRVMSRGCGGYAWVSRGVGSVVGVVVGEHVAYFVDGDRYHGAKIVARTRK
jgi:hypothetical protein